MPSPRTLTSLNPEELKTAREATTALVVTYKGYLPPGGLLRMLLSRFRDDIREITGMPAEGLPKRGEHHELDELTSTELDAIASAVATLLQDGFTAVMTDPELAPLLSQFYASLTGQKNERAQRQAELQASAES
jgi:hypothetical protein